MPTPNLSSGPIVTALITSPLSVHFSETHSLAIASQRGIGWGDVPFYILAKVLGALLGVGAAHLMFAEAVLQVSEHAREGSAQLFSEFVATFGLLCVIWGCARLRSEAVPWQSASTLQEPIGLQLQPLSPILRSRSHGRLRIPFPGFVRSTRLVLSWPRSLELLLPQFFSAGLCQRRARLYPIRATIVGETSTINVNRRKFILGSSSQGLRSSRPSSAHNAQLLDRLDKSADEVIVNPRRHERKPRHFQRAIRGVALRSEHSSGEARVVVNQSAPGRRIAVPGFRHRARNCAHGFRRCRTTEGRKSSLTRRPSLARRSDSRRRYCRTDASTDRPSDHFSKCGLAAS